ncbi:phage FluMu protein gp38 [Pseudomonas putida]|nr:phage FluMu protein gp38 [Pseudomonas putida]
MPDPELGGTLPAAGREVPRDAYWLRRLRAGDVTDKKSAAAKASTKAPATTGSAE